MIDLAQAAADHAGELDGTIILTISGGSAVFARVMSKFLKTDRAQLVAATLISTGVLAVWVYSAGAWSREGAFGLLMGFGSVLSATFGIFTGSKPETVSAVASTLTGGRIGGTKE